MFEAIEDTNATIPASVLDHVQAVFTKAKQLKARMAELTELEKEKRKSSTIQPFQIKGYSEVADDYRSNMNSLEVDGEEFSEQYLFVIQSQKHELESHLADIGNYREEYNDKMKAFEAEESSLQGRSLEYVELLASGDITAADEIEKSRLAQLHDTGLKKQEAVHKFEGLKKSESLLKDNISLYAEMEMASRRNLLLQQYAKVKSGFDIRIESIKEDYETMDGIANQLWGDNLHRYEHRNQLIALAKARREFAA